MFNENTWKEGEKLTAEYMKEFGYKIVYTNFHCAGVELDIVAILPRKVQIKKLKAELKEKLKIEKNEKLRSLFKQHFQNLQKNVEDLLIITEVKARMTNTFGTGAEAVDSTKIYHMKKGADYLLSKAEFQGMQIRFDIASVDANKVTYIENAF